MAPPDHDPRADARAAILRAWIALERFDTKTLDRPDPPGRPPRGRRRFAVDVGPREPLPWESGHPAYGQPLISDRVEWRHTLHLGQFDVGAAYERVEAKFPESPEARELRRTTRGTAPLLAMAVTPDGRPIMDSLQVSSAAWSIAQTLRVGVDDPAWLVGFDDALDEVRGAFERIVIDGVHGPREADDRDEGGGDEGAGGSPVSDDGAEPIEDASRALRVVADDGASADERAAAAADGESSVPFSLDAPPTAKTVAFPSALEAVARESTAESRARVAIDDEGIATAPITWDHILRALGAASAILKLEGQLTIRPVVRSTTWAESRRVPYGGGDTLLNSFAVDDLQRVAWSVEGKPPGAALARYLDSPLIAAEEAEERTDLDLDLATARESSAPGRIPAGRWPAEAAHDLALGQQLAVDLALGPDEPPILAVNGPPGTGKTTMLRDLIAGVVTERAALLAAFEEPGELFRGEALSVNGDRVVKVHTLARGIAGSEILLACATNAAAQNVSLELPDLGAIDGEWRADAGYLADFATAALRTSALSDLRGGDDEASGRRPARPQRFAGPGPGAGAVTLDGLGAFAAPDPADAEPHERAAWGLVAARLGRRSYCKDFAGAIWWGTAPRPGDRNARDRGPRIAPTDRAERGLAALLNGTQNERGREAWAESKERFLDALGEVERLRGERQALADALAPAEALEDEVRATQAAARAADADAARLKAEQAKAAKTAAPLVVAHAAAKKALEALGAPRAGHTKGRLSSEAQAAEDARKNALAKADLAKRDATAALDRARVATREAEDARARATEARAGADAVSARLEARAAAAEALEGGGHPFVVPDAAWEVDRDERDLRAPWSDEAWNRARTECFLAALDLHEATLLANGRDARRNLAVAIDLLTGRVSGLTREVVKAAWQTLFLLVPVVSTTFASLPTMLTGVGQEDLGWLLIDEAGQADPQQAVGALWRCRQAVVVGDPLQLEPVSGLPASLADAIRARFEVPLACISPEASVQRLADAVTPWGGRRGEDDLWVGVPLNVHRRCEPAIFELVNAIAYDGRMVNATRVREAHPALRVETCWLDVPASAAGADGHWLPAEGHRLDALLAHLGMNGYDFRQVFAVSPFRDVAWQLRRRADDPRHTGMTGGTVHTIQGREADTVILVLGGDPARPGAREWAAASPNLLNVAVSRARQRLYVIGDHDAWTPLPFFAQLAGLRRVAPPGARRVGAR